MGVGVTDLARFGVCDLLATMRVVLVPHRVIVLAEEGCGNTGELAGEVERQTNKQTNKRTNEQTNEQTKKRANKRTNTQNTAAASTRTEGRKAMEDARNK